jgi:hypothetical protein
VNDEIKEDREPRDPDENFRADGRIEDARSRRRHYHG